MTRYKGLRLGCTVARHRQLGVHAPINAKAGEAWRNDPSDGFKGKHDGYIDLVRDAQKMKSGVVVRRWNSRWFSKRFAHLLHEETGR